MRDFPHVEGVTHRFVDVPGARLHVAEAGDASKPAVLLIHGWPEHWFMWRKVMPVLAADFHVLAMDFRGAGWSEVTKEGYEKSQLADDVIALLDAEGIDKVLLAGHDWGGWISQLVAIKAPERVSRLVVLNIAPVWAKVSDGLPIVHRLLYQPVIAAPGLGSAVQRSAAFKRALVRQGVDPEAAEEYGRSFREKGRARAGSMLYRTFLAREAPLPGGGRRPLGQLKVPAKVLFGKDDPVIRPRLLRGFTHAGIDIQFVEGCGHFIVDERPELVADFLRDWFSRG